MLEFLLVEHLFAQGLGQGENYLEVVPKPTSFLYPSKGMSNRRPLVSNHLHRAATEHAGLHEAS